MSKKHKIAMQAINDSIAVWAERVERPPCDATIPSAMGCPCCVRYYITVSQSKGCRDCPIKQFTGKSECEGTPFLDAYEAHANFVDSDQPSQKLLFEWQAAAAKEVAFLRKVRDHTATEYMIKQRKKADEKGQQSNTGDSSHD